MTFFLSDMDKHHHKFGLKRHLKFLMCELFGFCISALQSKIKILSEIMLVGSHNSLINILWNVQMVILLILYALYENLNLE